jgi:hypothetical protein
MKNRLTYETTDPAVSLDGGVLHAFGHPTRDLYVPNGQPRIIDPRVTLNIPAGATVHIEGLEEHRRKGIDIVALTLRGPQRVDLRLTVRNHSNSTVQLVAGQPVALIHAVETPNFVTFHNVNDDRPAPAPQRVKKAPPRFSEDDTVPVAAPPLVD